MLLKVLLMMMLLIEKTKMLMLSIEKIEVLLQMIEKIKVLLAKIEKIEVPLQRIRRSKCFHEGSKDQSVAAKGLSDHMMQKMKTLKSSCSKLLMNVEKLPVTYRCITLMMLKMLSLLLLLLLLL